MVLATAFRKGKIYRINATSHSSLLSGRVQHTSTTNAAPKLVARDGPYRKSEVTSTLQDASDLRHCARFWVAAAGAAAALQVSELQHQSNCEGRILGNAASTFSVSGVNGLSVRSTTVSHPPNPPPPSGEEEQACGKLWWSEHSIR